MTLDQYLKAQGHGAAKRLAEEIGAHAPDVSDWAVGKREVPILRCVAIEKATCGLVTRRELRPHDYRDIWPELAAA